MNEKFLALSPAELQSEFERMAEVISRADSRKMQEMEALIDQIAELLPEPSTMTLEALGFCLTCEAIKIGKTDAEMLELLAWMLTQRRHRMEIERCLN